MIYPITAYGDPVLKKKARDIEKSELDLNQLIDDMFQTMYNAKGVGLAGPQIGKNLRIFVIDGEPMEEDELIGFKKVFVNPVIEKEFGEEWIFEEGCLSIPTIRENISRNESLKIRYCDENWKEHVEEYDGMKARIIQHEYDHIEGILFTDRISGFKKRILKSKLNNISKGKVSVDYKMRFPIK